MDAPDRRNALAVEDWEGLIRLLDRIRAYNAEVVVVASAQAGMFCAGLDFEELAWVRTDTARARRLYQAMSTALDVLEELPAITLAAVDGGAVGAGCALAMACDLRFAGSQAVFRTPPAHLGLVYPAADVRRLVRGVGYAGAMRMLSTGDALRGDEIARMNIAFPVAEDSLSECLQTAQKILAAAPGRLGTMKRTAVAAYAGKVEKGLDAEEFIQSLQSEEVGRRLRVRRRNLPVVCHDK